MPSTNAPELDVADEPDVVVVLDVTVGVPLEVVVTDVVEGPSPPGPPVLVVVDAEPPAPLLAEAPKKTGVALPHAEARTAMPAGTARKPNSEVFMRCSRAPFPDAVDARLMGGVMQPYELRDNATVHGGDHPGKVPQMTQTFTYSRDATRD